MPVSKAQAACVAKYRKKNYDRMEILVPKGTRDILRALAKEQGDSTNAYIHKALQAYTGNKLPDFKSAETDTTDDQ